MAFVRGQALAAPAHPPAGAAEPAHQGKSSRGHQREGLGGECRTGRYPAPAGGAPEPQSLIISGFSGKLHVAAGHIRTSWVLRVEELKTLGRYKIQGVRGKGDMGLVYDGLDPNLNRRVAIKTI